VNVHSLTLFAHLLGMLGLFAVLGFEALMLLTLRCAVVSQQAQSWIESARKWPPLAGISAIVVVGSGIYLGANTTVWRTAWMRLSVACLIPIIGLGVVLLRQLRSMQNRIVAGYLEVEEIRSLTTSGVLPFCVAIRLTISLAIVMLMVTKPLLAVSLVITGAFFALGVLWSIWPSNSP
jgi:hypothetical protein